VAPTYAADEALPQTVEHGLLVEEAPYLPLGLVSHASCFAPPPRGEPSCPERHDSRVDNPRGRAGSPAPHWRRSRVPSAHLRTMAAVDDIAPVVEDLLAVRTGYQGRALGWSGASGHQPDSLSRIVRVERAARRRQVDCSRVGGARPQGVRAVGLAIAGQCWLCPARRASGLRDRSSPRQVPCGVNGGAVTGVSVNGLTGVAICRMLCRVVPCRLPVHQPGVPV
jgi:hypothetical protein